jgi:hypothetical protein
MQGVPFLVFAPQRSLFLPNIEPITCTRGTPPDRTETLLSCTVFLRSSHFPSLFFCCVGLNSLRLDDHSIFGIFTAGSKH